ncbi:hypothetical protein NLI96_g10402 [Meripilus lineatus]|uniref:Yeast cell wall synthesis Kre9/Knh1-like N-terminal domain-containing protein n=1 Tax=Meripilus lineatus TaxID=2056292 RepID=A0AAD5Y9C2_9APHY|nr:hypothetical protein NLI96_g10402 [Physisporinus lineatus]
MFRFASSTLLLSLIALVQANIYVTHPIQGDSCAAGKECKVEWLEDGTSPQLKDIGNVQLGVYHGNGLLVQQLSNINVAATRSASFTLDRNAGANSEFYYIKFTAVNLVDGKEFNEYSPQFTMTGMTGRFSRISSSVSSATTPVPSSSGSSSSAASSGSHSSSASSGSHSASSSASVGSSASSSHISSSSHASSTPSSSRASSSPSSSGSPTPTSPLSSTPVTSASVISVTPTTLLVSASLSSLVTSPASSSGASTTALPISASATNINNNGAFKTSSGQSSLIFTVFAMLAVFIFPLI